MKRSNYQPIYLCSQCFEPVRRIRKRNHWRWSHAQTWRNNLHQPMAVVEREEIERQCP